MQGRIKTMKIYDSNNLLLAQKVIPFSTDSKKQFFTDDHSDFQVASFKLCLQGRDTRDGTRAYGDET